MKKSTILSKALSQKLQAHYQMMIHSRQKNQQLTYWSNYATYYKKSYQY